MYWSEFGLTRNSPARAGKPSSSDAIPYARIAHSSAARGPASAGIAEVEATGCTICVETGRRRTRSVHCHEDGAGQLRDYGEAGTGSHGKNGSLGRPGEPRSRQGGDHCNLAHYQSARCEEREVACDV